MPDTLQPDSTLSFLETVRGRHSVRAFLSDPVPDSMIRAVLEDAQRAPSNCNTQPWVVHIASGATRDRLSAALLKAAADGHYSKDFSFDVAHYPGRCRERQMEQGKAYHEALTVERDDKTGRQGATESNYTFFNAPHVALLFMPSIGDNVRAAADVGMYAQTFLLSLVARGLGGVPQTSLGMFADTIKTVLGVPTELKFLFGISFGYSDTSAKPNKLVMPRDPIAASVTFHD